MSGFPVTCDWRIWGGYGSIRHTRFLEGRLYQIMQAGKSCCAIRLLSGHQAVSATEFIEVLLLFFGFVVDIFPEVYYY